MVFYAQHPQLVVHGRMLPLTDQRLPAEITRQLVESVMTREQREMFERDLECNFAISVSGLARFRVNVSANLRAIISQRLVPTIDGKGRKSAVEILINTPTVAERILNGDFTELKDLMARSRELGMRTFDWALFDLYDAGHISYEDALHNADSANELRLNIKLKSTRGEPREASSALLTMEEEETMTPEVLAAQREKEMLRQEDKRRQVERERLEREYQKSKLAQERRRQKEDEELHQLQVDKSLSLDHKLLSQPTALHIKI